MHHRIHRIQAAEFASNQEEIRQVSSAIEPLLSHAMFALRGTHDEGDLDCLAWIIDSAPAEVRSRIPDGTLTWAAIRKNLTTNVRLASCRPVGREMVAAPREFVPEPIPAPRRIPNVPRPSAAFAPARSRETDSETIYKPTAERIAAILEASSTHGATVVNAKAQIAARSVHEEYAHALDLARARLARENTGRLSSGLDQSAGTSGVVREG
jgi:hypothetical protein